MNQIESLNGFNKSLFVKVIFLSVTTMVFSLFPLYANGNKALDKANTTNDKENVEGQYKGFELKLTIQHGHIGHVFIGCKKGATDDFDSRVDDMAPPPGMGGVGYTFLVSPDKKYNLYRDIRGFSDRTEWVFYAKPGTKPVKISWDQDSIPSGWNMYCSPWDGKSEVATISHDCRQIASVETDKIGYFRFRVERESVAESKGQ